MTMPHQFLPTLPQILDTHLTVLPVAFHTFQHLPTLYIASYESYFYDLYGI